MTIHRNAMIFALLVVAFISCTGIFGVAMMKVYALKQYSFLFAVVALYLCATASAGFIVLILGEKSPKV